MTMNQPGKLHPEAYNTLLGILKTRFVENRHRHPNVEWNHVQARLEAAPDCIWSLQEMEHTGGEPDVTGRDEATGKIHFMDCSKESPAGRRSLCYDAAALESRKEYKPRHSAMGMALEMGIALLDEEHYRRLQAIEHIDTKTSSWVLTPSAIRDRGGALFGDQRYGSVFIYHNGAESYYAARGFRGLLIV